MPKRMFTDVLEWSELVATATDGISTDVQDIVVQEDILIQGVYIEADMSQFTPTLAVAGSESVRVLGEVSTAGRMGQAGAIGRIGLRIVRGLQGAITPALELINTHNQIYIPLPEPILVKEEGTVNLYVARFSDVGANVQMIVTAILHFTKISGGNY